jgi:hypothetical protein
MLLNVHSDDFDEECEDFKTFFRTPKAPGKYYVPRKNLMEDLLDIFSDHKDQVMDIDMQREEEFKQEEEVGCSK